MPFDHTFYQACCDVAAQRGYPVPRSEPFSPLTYFSTGTIYGATASAFGPSGYRDTTLRMAGGENDAYQAQRVWIALCTAYAVFIDSIPREIMIPRELDSLRAFNGRLVNGEKQGNTVLDALADLLREAPRVFGGPVPANLATNSILDFITATIVEVETEDMKISTSAKQYPNYLRVMSGGSLVYAVAAFPPDIPFNEYIQAIPELTLFIGAVNDVLSFYKEELDGESNTHIAMMAAQKGISRVEALEEFADIAVDMYRRVVGILEGSSQSGLGEGVGSWGPGDKSGVDNQERDGGTGVIPRSSRGIEAFKHFAAGYFVFHLSAGRYRLMEVGF
ncbi:terpenoid synthase [Paxillus ammoniavirescens]|nr:terpenoid synthase [Paxillus ammoniavirescens]